MDITPAQTRTQNARNAVHLAVVNLVRAAGGRIIDRPVIADSRSLIRDAEPLAGLAAARELELAARFAGRQYARDAREAGRTWLEIGQALGLSPGGELATVADAAFSYGAGDPNGHHARTNGQSMAWMCRSCTRLVTDHGPGLPPDDSERGHAETCQRFAAAVEAWRIAWNELDRES